MTRLNKITKKLLVTLLGLSTSFSGIANVHACGGGRSGGGFSFGGGYRGNYFQQTSYQAPRSVQYMPAGQPVSVQQYPGYQTQYSSQVPQQPTYAPAPQQPMHAAPQQPQPVANHAGFPQHNGTAAQAQFGLGTQPQSAPVAPPQFATNGQTPGTVPNQLPPSNQQTIVNRPITPAAPTQPTQQFAQPTQPIQQPTIAPNPSVTAPSAPAGETPNAAEQSALQALAGLLGDEPAEAAPPVEASSNVAAPDYIGNWNAALPNGTSVSLALQADGSFRWSATTSGNTTSFEGTYVFEDGSLSLARSTDNTRLSGSFTSLGNNGFNFKLSGANDTGLNFSRS